MDDTEITALAREFAEEMTKDIPHDNDIKSLRESAIKLNTEGFEKHLRWLLCRYRLVRKDNPAILLGMVSNGEYNAKFAEGVEATIGLLFPDLEKEAEG